MVTVSGACTVAIFVRNMNENDSYQVGNCNFGHSNQILFIWPSVISNTLSNQYKA